MMYPVGEPGHRKYMSCVFPKKFDKTKPTMRRAPDAAANRVEVRTIAGFPFRDQHNTTVPSESPPMRNFGRLAGSGSCQSMPGSIDERPRLKPVSSRSFFSGLKATAPSVVLLAKVPRDSRMTADAELWKP